MPFLRWIRNRLSRSAKKTDAADPPDPQLIKQRGWLQWACVAPGDIRGLLKDAWARFPGEIEGCARLLIVSQSCDLVHHSYENEPAAEAYLCEPLAPDARTDGNLTAGKNPRSFQVQLLVDNNERWFHLRASGRVLIPRHCLASIAPDPSVDVPEKSIRILQRWVINRTVRTAFPGTFDKRTEKARDELEKKLKKGGTHLLGLYINLTPWDELPEDEKYAIDLVGLVDVDAGNEQRTTIEKLLGDVAVGYNNSDAISSCDYQVLDEDEAQLNLLRTHRLFPLDYLSLRDKPGGNLPPIA